ncbi:MAG: hypothetical protein ACAI44_06365 [Candidatus Sericytochromatia bacterium]
MSNPLTYLSALSTLPDWLRIPLMLAIMVLGLVFVLGPLLLKAQHRIQRNFELVPSQPEAVPAVARSLAEAERPAFEQAGFDWLGYYRLGKYTPNTEAWFGLYRHRHDAGLGAMTAAIYQLPAVGSPVFALSYSEVSALFDSGFSLCVNNSVQAGAFESESKLMLRYPGQPVPLLVQYFRQVKSRHSRCHHYAPLPVGQELGRIRQQLLRELDDQVRQGIYRLDTAQNQYRLTWTGAIVMTLRHLPPFTWMRGLAARRLAGAWARRMTNA